MAVQSEVLTALRAQLEGLRNATISTPKEDFTALQWERSLGRQEALSEALLLVMDAQRADLREQTEIAQRSRRLRENCLKLGQLYEQLSKWNAMLIPRLPADKRGLLEAQQPVLGLIWPVLIGLATAIKPDDFAQVEIGLGLVEKTVAQAKALALMGPPAGKVQ